MDCLPIRGYESSYTINRQGEVYSVARTIVGSDGTVYPFKAKKKSITPNTSVGYLQVALWKSNKVSMFYIHRLLMEHFVPNPENKKEVNHIDGNRQNNSLDNLEWVTRAENAQHAVRTGLKVYTNRLTEAEFLACLYDVINGESYKTLSERVPYKVPFLSTKVRKIAIKYNLENQLDEALYQQKVNRARINGNCNR